MSAACKICHNIKIFLCYNVFVTCDVLFVNKKVLDFRDYEKDTISYPYFLQIT